MKYIDCDLETCVKKNENKRVIFFGAGQNLLFAEHSKLSSLQKCVPYIVDNGDYNRIILWGKDIPIYHPKILENETECSIIITTSKYMADMYKQLLGLNLSERIELYIFPFMLLKEKQTLNSEQRKRVFVKNDNKVIPKVIHSFWFSGSPKPEAYQRCIDTWKKVCPDYEVIEWNMDRYDFRKHPFVEGAIKAKAWAYATDYARLDVINEYGGIYMDMDVELVKDLDTLLSHEGVFPFCSDGVIELAMFMARSHNPLVEKMLRLYDYVEIPTEKKDFNQFYQPLFVMNSIIDYGVMMNGSFQMIEGNVFLPRQICMPLDYCLYELKTDEDTVAIHHANAGWHEADYTARRVDAIRGLLEQLV